MRTMHAVERLESGDPSVPLVAETKLEPTVDARMEAQANLLGSVMKGEAPEVQDLLRQRAEVGFRYDDGLTPLHFAALFNKPAVAKVLLGAGADTNARTTDEVMATPAQLAMVSDHKEVLVVLKDGGGGRKRREALFTSGEGAVAWQSFQKRFAGPLMVAAFMFCVAAVAWTLTDPNLRWDGWREAEASPWGTAQLHRSILMGCVFWCLFCLVSVNGLDPGTVRREDVAYVEELFEREDPRKIEVDQERFGWLRDDGECDTFVWCTSCELWRPKNVSHCSTCRRCFWRFDHYCRAVGTCIAAGNHVAFALLVLSSAATWFYAAATVTWHVQAHGTDLNLLTLLNVSTTDWPVLVAIPYVLGSCFCASFLTVFGFFHAGALCFNYNTKMLLRPKSSETHWKFNTAEVCAQLFCSPVQFRPVDDCNFDDVKGRCSDLLGARFDVSARTSGTSCFRRTELVANGSDSDDGSSSASTVKSSELAF